MEEEKSLTSLGRRISVEYLQLFARQKLAKSSERDMSLQQQQQQQQGIVTWRTVDIVMFYSSLTLAIFPTF